jgi:hypothetical protein
VPGDISARCLSIFAYPVKQNFASLHHPKLHCITSPTAASGQPSRTAAAAAVLDQAVIYEDRLQINPGSASGSYSTFSKAVQPSFVLMDLDGSKVGHLCGEGRGGGSAAGVLLPAACQQDKAADGTTALDPATSKVTRAVWDTRGGGGGAPPPGDCSTWC